MISGHISGHIRGRRIRITFSQMPFDCWINQVTSWPVSKSWPLRKISDGKSSPRSAHQAKLLLIDRSLWWWQTHRSWARCAIIKLRAFFFDRFKQQTKYRPLLKYPLILLCNTFRLSIGNLIEREIQSTGRGSMSLCNKKRKANLDHFPWSLI